MMANNGVERVNHDIEKPCGCIGRKGDEIVFLADGL